MGASVVSPGTCFNIAKIRFAGMITLGFQMEKCGTSANFGRPAFDLAKFNCNNLVSRCSFLSEAKCRPKTIFCTYCRPQFYPLRVWFFQKYYLRVVCVIWSDVVFLYFPLSIIFEGYLFGVYSGRMFS